MTNNREKHFSEKILGGVVVKGRERVKKSVLDPSFITFYFFFPFMRTGENRLDVPVRVNAREIKILFHTTR